MLLKDCETPANQKLNIMTYRFYYKIGISNKHWAVKISFNAICTSRIYEQEERVLRTH